MALAKSEALKAIKGHLIGVRQLRGRFLMGSVVLYKLSKGMRMIYSLYTLPLWLT